MGEVAVAAVPLLDVDDDDDDDDVVDCDVVVGDDAVVVAMVTGAGSTGRDFFSAGKLLLSRIVLKQPRNKNDIGFKKKKFSSTYMNRTVHSINEIHIS